jgi:hypothetical protein
MLIPWFLGMFSAVFVLFFYCLFLCYWVSIVLFYSICFYVALDLPWFFREFCIIVVVYSLECLWLLIYLGVSTGGFFVL